MQINATRHIRRMRGVSQAHLFFASDNCYYVVKLRSTPRGPRVLANEALCYGLMGQLGLSGPGWSPTYLPSPPPCSEDVARVLAAACGSTHFGSRYPVDPTRFPVYDYLPAVIRRSVLNRSEFLGMLCFDKWVGHAGTRQAIFHRKRESTADRGLDTCSERQHVASMISHSRSFGAQNWNFADQVHDGLCPWPEMYDEVLRMDSLAAWIDTIQSRAASAIDHALRLVHPEWIGNDRDQLEQLLEELYQRRVRLPDLLRRTIGENRHLFARWLA